MAAKRTVVRPMDVVRTPKGAIALVTESDGVQASIEFFPNDAETWEKSAWWDHKELTVLGNVFVMIADATAHNCGDNQEQGEKFFGK